LFCLTDTSLYIYICVKHFGMANIKIYILGESENFENLRHVSMSVRLSAWSNSAYTWRIFMKSIIFRKSIEKPKVSLKSDKNNGHCAWIITYISDHISLSSYYNDKFFRQTCIENQNEHFILNNSVPKIVSIWDKVEKYCTAEQATCDNMAHAHCMLDTYGYRHTLRICNIIEFPVQQWLQNAPQYYVMRTLPVMLGFHYNITKRVI